MVEDSPEDLEALARTARKLGVESPLLHAADGDSALELLRGLPAPPRLVLLDLNLPGLDGREVLRALRADAAFASVPVAVLTTSADPAEVEACRAAGADAYLLKPVGLDVLREKLAALLAAIETGDVLPFPY